MASVNRVMLIGNVGKEPEIRTTQDGKRIANFSIATTETWKDKSSGEKKSKTEWHRVAVFNDGLVGVIERFVSKGTQLYIEGSLVTRKWTDSSGVDKYSTEVHLQGFNASMVILGGSKEGVENSGGDNAATDDDSTASLSDYEAPF